MSRLRLRQSGIWFVLLFLVAQSAAAITISLDYSYDAANFFGAGNPQGKEGDHGNA